ncbi:MAG: DUF1232 domain-containing protein [Tannerellaceae bacterium]|nr:DUF1232 domain-containing protein [Tannerellaceae bacterium]MCD8264265.1 DUF1232 domain-containing protein [Tannerellaceae bacterium]
MEWKKRKIEDVPFQEIREIEKYGSYYSESRLWKKIKRIAKRVGGTVLKPALLLYYLLQDEKVPVHHKAYTVGALGYFIMPFDLIPDHLLPVIGFADDVALMAFVLKLVEDSITPEIEARATEKLNSILHTNVI